MSSRRLLRAPVIASSGAALLLTATACGGGGSPSPRAERISVDAGQEQVRLLTDLVYSGQGDDALALDACLPPDGGDDLPALVLVHGGGFTSGDRVGGGMRGLCETAAREGIAAFSIDYRLAPEHTFPAPVEDLASAVAWLRQPQQAATFGIDPARIGVLGSSAGAVLALAVGTQGEGSLDAGSRVRAVVSLSGVADFRPQALSEGDPSPEALQLGLTYLGCTDPTACPVAAEASSVLQVDATDPPVLLINGSDELVPVQQADEMAAALQAAGVPHEEVVVDGNQHGMALVSTEVRTKVWTFLEENL